MKQKAGNGVITAAVNNLNIFFPNEKEFNDVQGKLYRMTVNPYLIYENEFYAAGISYKNSQGLEHFFTGQTVMQRKSREHSIETPFYLSYKNEKGDKLLIGPKLSFTQRNSTDTFYSSDVEETDNGRTNLAALNFTANLEKYIDEKTKANFNAGVNIGDSGFFSYSNFTYFDFSLLREGELNELYQTAISFRTHQDIWNIVASQDISLNASTLVNIFTAQKKEIGEKPTVSVKVFEPLEKGKDISETYDKFKKILLDAARDEKKREELYNFLSEGRTVSAFKNKISTVIGMLTTEALWQVYEQDRFFLSEILPDLFEINPEKMTTLMISDEDNSTMLKNLISLRIENNKSNFFTAKIIKSFEEGLIKLKVREDNQKDLIDKIISYLEKNGLYQKLDSHGNSVESWYKRRV
jgi:hypothetical protein